MSTTGKRPAWTKTKYVQDRSRAMGSVCPWQRLTGMGGKTGEGARTQGPYMFGWHSPRIFVAILGVILLSVIDGALTLFLVDCGAKEINPVMAYFLNHGPLVFFWAKYLLTCMPLIFILMHKGVNLLGTGVKAEALFLWIAIPYALVVYWELYLLLGIL